MKRAITVCWLAMSASVMASGEEAVSLRQERDALLVSAFVDGVGPYPMMLDLGLDQTVLSRDVVSYLSLQTAGADMPVRLSSLAAGGREFGSCEALVADLDELTARLGTRAAGMLPGWLPGKRLTLDIEGGRCVFEDRPEKAENGMLDVEDDNGVPMVTLSVNETHGCSVALDTTFGGTVALPETVLSDWGLLNASTPRLTVRPGPAGTPPPLGAAQIRLERIALGAASVKSPVCVVLGAGETARVGLAFLRHFQVVLDRYGDAGAVCLKARDGTTPPVDPPVVGYGIGLAQCRDGYWTVCVAADSPADRAGVAWGDRLVAVDGEDMKGQSYEAVTGWLSAAVGDTVEVEVLQFEGRRQFELTAEEML